MAARSLVRNSVLAAMAAASVIASGPAAAQAWERGHDGPRGDRRGDEVRPAMPQRPIAAPQGQFRPERPAQVDMRPAQPQARFQQPRPDWQPDRTRPGGPGSAAWNQNAWQREQARDQARRDWSQNAAERERQRDQWRNDWQRNADQRERQRDQWRNDWQRNADQRERQRDQWRDDRQRDAWARDRQRNQWQQDRGRDNRWANNGWNRNDSNRNGWGNNTWRRWDHDWRRDNRYNWYDWRARHRDVFRLGGYYAPYRGYSYSRLSIGFTLGAPFFAQQYWLGDPWAYRLPPAYGPYRWVRYYGDALLVDIYTGEVVDAVYDLFD